MPDWWTGTRAEYRRQGYAASEKHLSQSSTGIILGYAVWQGNSRSQTGESVGAPGPKSRWRQLVYHGYLKNIPDWWKTETPNVYNIEAALRTSFDPTKTLDRVEWFDVEDQKIIDKLGSIKADPSGMVSPAALDQPPTTEAITATTEAITPTTKEVPTTLTTSSASEKLVPILAALKPVEPTERWKALAVTIIQTYPSVVWDENNLQAVIVPARDAEFAQFEPDIVVKPATLDAINLGVLGSIVGGEPKPWETNPPANYEWVRQVDIDNGKETISWTMMEIDPSPDDNIILPDEENKIPEDYFIFVDDQGRFTLVQRREELEAGEVTILKVGKKHDAEGNVVPGIDREGPPGWMILQDGRIRDFIEADPEAPEADIIYMEVIKNKGTLEETTHQVPYLQYGTTLQEVYIDDEEKVGTLVNIIDPRNPVDDKGKPIYITFIRQPNGVITPLPPDPTPGEVKNIPGFGNFAVHSDASGNTRYVPINPLPELWEKGAPRGYKWALTEGPEEQQEWALEELGEPSIVTIDGFQYFDGPEGPQLIGRVPGVGSIETLEGRQYIQQPDGSLQLLPPDRLTLDELIAEAFVSGDSQRALDLSILQEDPLGLDRLNAAMQYARSPGDYFTILKMARGEIPVGPIPRSQIYDLGMFGLDGEPMAPSVQQGVGLEGTSDVPTGVPTGVTTGVPTGVTTDGTVVEEKPIDRTLTSTTTGYDPYREEDYDPRNIPTFATQVANALTRTDAAGPKRTFSKGRPEAPLGEKFFNPNDPNAGNMARDPNRGNMAGGTEVQKRTFSERMPEAPTEKFLNPNGGNMARWEVEI